MQIVRRSGKQTIITAIIGIITRLARPRGFARSREAPDHEALLDSFKTFQFWCPLPILSPPRFQKYYPHPPLLSNIHRNDSLRTLFKTMYLVSSYRFSRPILIIKMKLVGMSAHLDCRHHSATSAAPRRSQPCSRRPALPKCDVLGTAEVATALFKVRPRRHCAEVATALSKVRPRRHRGGNRALQSATSAAPQPHSPKVRPRRHCGGRNPALFKVRPRRHHGGRNRARQSRRPVCS